MIEFAHHFGKKLLLLSGFVTEILFNSTIYPWATEQEDSRK